MSFLSRGTKANSETRYSPQSINKETPLVQKIKSFHWYQQYSQAPKQDITIEEFEYFALNRLRRLRLLENGIQRGLRTEQLLKEVFKGDDARFLEISAATFDDQEDFLSHYILRIAFCRNEDQQRWLTNIETELYKLRLHYWWNTVQNQVNSAEIFESLNLDYEPIYIDENSNQQQEYTIGSNQKRQKLNNNNVKSDEINNKLNAQDPDLRQRLQLLKFYRDMHNDNQNKENKNVTISRLLLFKVPFQEVPELVSQRKVILLQGKAFITQDQISILITHQFKETLLQRLQEMGKKYYAIFGRREQDRLAPIVENMHMRYLGKDYSQSKVGEVRLHDLPKIYKKSFPLCMQNLYEKVNQNGHLKHNGRQQFGLFLKGIGLPLEDALVFWKSCFSKQISNDQFEKEYAYNIRHNYGKEGKRTDYTPYSCQKIISMTPGNDEYHGCPYKNLNAKKLTEALNKLYISQRVVEEVVDKAKNNHYQIACGLVFEAIHKQPCDEGITHPNKFFEESQQVQKAQSKVTEPISATKNFANRFNRN